MKRSPLDHTADEATPKQRRPFHAEISRRFCKYTASTTISYNQDMQPIRTATRLPLRRPTETAPQRRRRVGGLRRGQGLCDFGQSCKETLQQRAFFVVPMFLFLLISLAAWASPGRQPQNPPAKHSHAAGPLPTENIKRQKCQCLILYMAAKIKQCDV